MKKKAIVLLADGFEDVEAVTPVDYLRRAGIEVTTAAIQQDRTVTSRWGGIKLIADTSLTELLNSAEQTDWDAVICPGGMPGASNLASSREVSAFLKNMSANGKLICAICASPVIVLSPLGLIKGKKFTCYPGMEEKAPEGTWVDSRVVADGNLITSRAAGTTGEFAVAIIEKLLDKETAKKIAETVLLF
ncbi:MAG: DJ-1/PfpI family protein [Treponema sp.]|jgi:4-methyl-5(b-hydroxyethyl)-thiazole monophosphate biosynthesis|nr:DJ-1/PfpI family protein [Treponema sp.]